MNRCRLLLVTLIMLAALQPNGAIGGNIPAVGDRLPPLQLPLPVSNPAPTYLGGPTGVTFDPLSIPGRLLFIEIFSMYCPHCQREAPHVNQLHLAVEASPTLRGQVKMIGIGVGNSGFEVSHYREHFKVAFPLFPDEEFEIHRSVGEVRTPFFIVVSLDPKDKGLIVWTGSGHLDPTQKIIDQLKLLLN